MIDEILGLTRSHEQWRERCINLIPSENVTSPAVRSLLSSEFGHRYSSRDGFYMGTRFMDEIEQYGEKLAREVFHSQKLTCVRFLVTRQTLFFSHALLAQKTHFYVSRLLTEDTLESRNKGRRVS